MSKVIVRWRALLALASALVIVGAACGDDDTASSDSTQSTAATGSSTTNVAAGPQTLPVQVDGKGGTFATSFLAYFPNEVTVHAGDTIDFTEVFTGEPHTVTFGALVDTGLAAMDKAAPDAQEEPPELAKIPLLIPNGPGDAIQSSAQPCFLDTGDPPPVDACPKAAQPDFDGKQSIFSSGFMADGEKFSVKLAADIAPGTYRYFCELHRAGMQGKITVVGPEAKAQTADEVKAAGDAKLNELIGKLQPAADALKALTPDKAAAGGGVPDLPDAAVNLFGPLEISIPVGGSVKWDVIGPHTVSFNSPEDARPDVVKAADGSVHVNIKAFAPAGGPGADPNAPPPAPGSGTIIDGGSWDGQGFRSSGFLTGFGPPGTLFFQMKFATAGTYKYLCLIHPDMEGTIKVA